MVAKGQFLERPTLVPVEKNVVLEGLWHRGVKKPAALILPPAPEEGSSMDHVVAAELSYAVSHAGHPTFRFNFRGVGASQGVRSGRPEQLCDAEAALRVLEESVSDGAVVVIGIGGSARTALALRERHETIRGVVLVSPRGVEPEELRRTAAPLWVVMGALERLPNRAALAAAVAESSGVFQLVEDADQGFLRNLPQVGRTVSRFFRRLSGEDISGEDEH